MKGTVLKVGDTFESIDDLKLAVVAHQQSNGELYYIEATALLDHTSKQADKLLYSKLKFACANRMIRTNQINCQAYILAECDDEKNYLIIKEINKCHNHPIEIHNKKKLTGIFATKKVQKSKCNDYSRSPGSDTVKKVLKKTIKEATSFEPNVFSNEISNELEPVQEPNFDFDFFNLKSPTPETDLADEVLILDDSSGAFKTVKRSTIMEEAADATSQINWENEIAACLRLKYKRPYPFDYNSSGQENLNISITPTSTFLPRFPMAGDASKKSVFGLLWETTESIRASSSSTNHINTSPRFSSSAKNNNFGKKLRPLADLLVGIGTSLLTHYVFKEMLSEENTDNSDNSKNEKLVRRISHNLKASNKALRFITGGLVTCKSCGFTAHCFSQLDRHYDNGSNNLGSNVCCLCSFHATHPALFVVHMKVFHGRSSQLMELDNNNMANCDLCGYVALNKIPQTHINACRSSFRLDLNLVLKIMECDLPLYDSDIPQKKKIMYKKDEAKNNYVAPTKPLKDAKLEICEICGGMAKDSGTLRMHYINFHQQILPPVNVEAQFVCKQHSEKFQTLIGYRKHLFKRHQSDQIDASDGVDNITSSSANQLDDTENQNTNSEKLYDCSLCKRQKQSKQLLLSHLNQSHRIALSDMLLARFCVLCLVSFKSMPQFEDHFFDKHKELIPPGGWAALGGGAISVAMSALTMNCKRQQAKSGVNVSCKVCHCTFPSLDVCKRHEEQIHGVKCRYCTQFVASSQKYLNVHMKDAHEHALDRCMLCGMFVWLSSMVKHFQEKHNIHCQVKLNRLDMDTLIDNKFILPKDNCNEKTVNDENDDLLFIKKKHCNDDVSFIDMNVIVDKTRATSEYDILSNKYQTDENIVFSEAINSNKDLEILRNLNDNNFASPNHESNNLNSSNTTFENISSENYKLNEDLLILNSYSVSKIDDSISNSKPKCDNDVVIAIDTSFSQVKNSDIDVIVKRDSINKNVDYDDINKCTVYKVDSNDDNDDDDDNYDSDDDNHDGDINKYSIQLNKKLKRKIKLKNRESKLRKVSENNETVIAVLKNNIMDKNEASKTDLSDVK